MMRTASEHAALRRTLIRHAALTALVAVVVSALVTTGLVLSAQREAYLRAEQIARQVGAAVIVPLSHHDFAMAVDPADRAELARELAPFLTSGMVDRVKVWTIRGDDARIAFSDEPRVEGEIDRTTSPDTARRLAAGEVLVRPVPDDAEHRFESPSAGTLLEAFVPFRDVAGAGSRLEVYVPVDEQATAWRTAAATLPVVLGGLLAMALATVPLSVVLARRMERERSEQRAIRRYGLAAAEASRRELARRLHDGVIPDLAGAGMLLEAVRAEEAVSGGRSSRELLDHAHELVTVEVRELRTLLGDLMPPDPATGDLGDSLRELAAQMRAPAVDGRVPDVSVDTSSSGDVPGRTAVLLHQVAGELIRNAFRHARAEHLRVAVTPIGGGGTSLVVTDDGVGFEPSQARADGHVGLLLVRRALDDHGGTMALTSVPGKGTTVSVSIPANIRQ